MSLQCVSIGRPYLRMFPLVVYIHIHYRISLCGILRPTPCLVEATEVQGRTTPDRCKEGRNRQVRLLVPLAGPLFSLINIYVSMENVNSLHCDRDVIGRVDRSTRLPNLQDVVL